MKIGDYVRTNDGYIYTIKKIPTEYKVIVDAKSLFGEELEIHNTEILKSNPNIIELLEPMDLLYIDIDGGFEGGIVVPRIPETLDELNGFVEFIKSGHWILKSIVTHEQLENDMYKVGE